jgi:adenylate kinase
VIILSIGCLARIFYNKNIMVEPYIILLFGRSGCGKGTQAELLMDYFKKKDGKDSVFYIYAGEKFREFSKRDSLTAKLVNEILSAGDKIPDFLAIWVWSNAMVEKMRKNLHVVIDGSPRTALEAKALDDAFEFYKLKNIKPILIDVSPEEIKDRLLKRGRADDTEERIKHRLAYYEKYVASAIEYYKRESKNELIVIDGNPHDVDLIHKNILKAISLEE